MRWSRPAQSVKLLHLLAGRVESTPRSAGEGGASPVICGARYILRSAGENRGFPFPRRATYAFEVPGAERNRSLHGATVAGAQVIDYDAVICASLSGEFTK